MDIILLVEDNDDIRENLAEIMELAGYKVHAAANGVQGVAMAILHMPDLVVCDIMMPELDGFGVLEQLRTTPGTKDMPIIFLTAMAEPKEKKLGMDLGAYDYIVKPISGDEPIASIKNYFKQRGNNEGAKKQALHTDTQQA